MVKSIQTGRNNLTGEEVVIDFGDVNFASVDDHIEYNNSDRKTDNYCKHTISHLTATHPGAYSYEDSAIPNVTFTNASLSGIFSHERGDTPNPWTPDFPGWEGNTYHAWNMVRPSMDSFSFSLPNFLLELGEIRRLFEFWDRRKKALKRAANLHLNLSFGWAPFVDDCKEIFDRIVSFRKRYEQFQAGLLKVQRRHFQVNLDALLPSTHHWADNPGHEVGYTTYEWVYKPKYTFSCRYVYSIPEQPMVAMKAILDYFGVRPNPRIIWDAVPYSFLVDWFLNIGQLLDSVGSGNLDVDVALLSCTQSLRWRSKTSSFWGLGSGGTVPVWNYVQGEYERIPLSDPSVVRPPLDIHLPGMREALLTGSLLVSRGYGDIWSRKIRAGFRKLKFASYS